MNELHQKGQSAKEASSFLALATTQEKNAFLRKLKEEIIKKTDFILSANAVDIENARQNAVSTPMVDRLTLTKDRIQEMAKCISQVAKLHDPIGEVTQMWKTEDGLTIGQKRVPIGVAGIIYESRPNVTIDAATLCFKAGNAVLLRGGSDAIHTNKALIKIVQATLQDTHFPKGCIQLIEDTSRETANEMMKLNRFLDVLIPRGGAKLIEAVISNATIPVIETGTGNCHIYVDDSADLRMATKIVVNAKCSRPSVCNAAETLLVHKKIAPAFLPQVEQALAAYHCELRADQEAYQYFSKAKRATLSDWETEFLDYVLAVKIVANIDEAIAHINTYNTKHSEAIVTSSYDHGQKFHNEVDAAAVYINASTRFTDGSAFGFGSEIGISTQKLHARGPMGLKELTSSKYIVFGSGQIRE